MQQGDLIKDKEKREILKNDKKPKPTSSIWQIRFDNMMQMRFRQWRSLPQV